MAVLFSLSHASDPSPLQDFCVAVNDSKNAGNLPNFLKKSSLLFLSSLFVNFCLVKIKLVPFFFCSFREWKILQESNGCQC